MAEPAIEGVSAVEPPLAEGSLPRSGCGAATFGRTWPAEAERTIPRFAGVPPREGVAGAGEADARESRTLTGSSRYSETAPESRRGVLLTRGVKVQCSSPVGTGRSRAGDGRR